MTKASLGGAKTAKKPTDHGKLGTERSVMTERLDLIDWGLGQPVSSVPSAGTARFSLGIDARPEPPTGTDLGFAD